MRDYTAAYPERTAEVGFVCTTDGKVIHVQGFRPANPDHPNRDMLWCPEFGYSVSGREFHTDFESAKAQAVKRAEDSVRWSAERLEKARALVSPALPAKSKEME